MTSASIIEALKQLEDEAFFPSGITVKVESSETAYRIALTRNETVLCEEFVRWEERDAVRWKNMGVENYKESDILRANTILLRRVLWEGVKTLGSKS